MIFSESLLTVLLTSEYFFIEGDEVATAETISQLQTKEDRKRWEEVFNIQYVHPVLKDLDKRLSKAIYLITTDDKQGMST